MAVALLALLSCSCGSQPTAPRIEYREAIDTYPSWAPDGTGILYWHRDTTSGSASYPTGLYRFQLPSGPKVLLKAGYVYSATYSPDGSTIAYRSGDGIHLMNSAGAADALVIPGPSFFPSWSPHGDMLAFDTSIHDPRGAHAIELYDLSTGETKDISVHGTGEWRVPHWSPDGSRLVHLRYVVGVAQSEVFTMDTTGHAPVRLTDDKVEDRDAQWSRDGSLIGWTRFAASVDEIWVMNANGSGRRRVTYGERPAFSPVGDEIVFVDPYAPSGSQLTLISIDGANLRRLTP